LGATVIPNGWLPLTALASVMTPASLIRAMLPLVIWVNQTVPSGDAAMSWGPGLLGVGKMVTALVAGFYAPGDRFRRGEVQMNVTEKEGTEQGAWPGAIAAITLFVEDLEAAKRFYREVFELPVSFEDDSSTVFRFGETLVNLLKTSEAPGLVEPATVANARRRGPVPVHARRGRRRRDVRETEGAWS
jgi:Glyoxalase/Bleomycin resistance protein/Dioxygenase superfamily